MFDAFRFAYLMIGDLEAASRITLDASPSRVVEQVLAREGRMARNSLDEHDTFTRLSTIRREPSDLTDALPVLQRRCLVELLGCIAPSPRCKIVLTEVLGLSDHDAAELMGTTLSAFRISRNRARARLEDYLEPRCSHVDPLNSCRCENRVTRAQENGFLKGEPVGGMTYLSGWVHPPVSLFRIIRVPHSEGGGVL